MTTVKPETVRIPGLWHIEYQYTVGPEAAAFFEGLQRGEMLGSVCRQCGQVAVPPKAFCEKCFTRVSEMIPVGLTGTIAASTVVTAPFEGGPDVPYCVAYVTLDGASTATANYVRGVSLREPVTSLPPEIGPGARVDVRFAPERRGRLSDFWFVPTGAKAG